MASNSTASNRAHLPNAAWSPAVLLGLIKSADIVLVVLTALISYWSRHGFKEIPDYYWLGIFISTLVTFQTFHMVGVYKVSNLYKLATQLGKLTAGWLLVGS
jgi:hypothetical protein